MIEDLGVQPGDRMLFLSIPEVAVLESVSMQIEHGLIACLGDWDQVAAGRKAAVHLDNVMFTPGELEEIPWQECFFSHVVHIEGATEMKLLAAREIARVLVPGGCAFLPGLNPEPFVNFGLVEVRSGCLQKPKA
jgi:hypothetical protein